MNSESDFLPIQSLDIEAETEINFNLYVNLPLNQKYLLYRKKGSSVASAKLENFSSNNVKNFFIDKSEYPEFIKYVALRIKSLVGTGNAEGSKKVMMSTARAILSSTFSENNPGVTSALMSNLSDITGLIIESILETSNFYNKKIFHKLLALAQTGTDFQKHPINVTSLSVLMTFGIGYNNDRILSDVAMAAMLHDIGLSKLSPTLITKAHSTEGMSPIERAHLYRHPEYAIQVLKEKNIKTTTLMETLILQHHEEFSGFGYPKGLRGYAVNELAQVIHVADELDQLIGEGLTQAVDLKLRVMKLLDQFAKDKVIEPDLCQRLRDILV